MNKTELINAISKKAGVTKIVAKQVLEATLETITETVKKNEKVTLNGFGNFELATRAARKGVNPANGQAIQIEAKEVFKFKASSNIFD